MSMKILVIGDFHGKFPDKKIKSVIKKNKIELVISLGDFFPFIYRKIWFEYCYKKDTELWEIIGRKKYKKLVEEDLKIGEKVLRKLNSLSISVITIIGNLDYTKILDTFDWKRKNKKWKWTEQDFFSKIIKKYKNIKRFDYSHLKYKKYVFIGAYGGTFPGKVKSKNYKKIRKKLDKLFKKFGKENKDKKVVFITHNVPYNTKIDKITSKEAHEEVKGKHYGSKLIRRIIERYQPVLAIGGHIHESYGRDKIGKTIIINPGAVYEGRMLLVNLPEKRKDNIKFRFIN